MSSWAEVRKYRRPCSVTTTSSSMRAARHRQWRTVCLKSEHHTGSQLNCSRRLLRRLMIGARVNRVRDRGRTATECVHLAGEAKVRRRGHTSAISSVPTPASRDRSLRPSTREPWRTHRVGAPSSSRRHRAVVTSAVAVVRVDNVEKGLVTRRMMRSVKLWGWDYTARPRRR